MRRVLLILIAVLSGCSCNQDCANLARFRLPVDLQLGADYRIEACVNGACTTQALVAIDGPRTSAGSITVDVDDDVVEFQLGTGDFTRPPELQVTISSDGLVLAEFRDTVEMETNRPNGAFCGPTCYVAEVEASVVE